jgi:acyl-CoA synthetase (AMP-forming)/AMP-acid ligase II
MALPFNTVGDILVSRSASKKKWLVFPKDPMRSDEADEFSFGEVYARAAAVASGLVTLGARRGDRVAILGDNDIQFVALFVGAVIADLVPVPVHGPGSVFTPRWREYTKRLERVLSDGDIRLLVVTDGFAEIEGPNDEQSAPAARSYSQIVGVGTSTALAPAATSSDIALIQYSSGSTRAPTGVALSHANLLHNVHSIGIAVENTEDDIVLNWAPLFHDMGLIGLFLYSLYWGLTLVLMSPRTVIAKPASWLWGMSRFRAIGTAAPNFLYALCASDRKVPDESLRGLDLRAWRHAMNSAEAVQARTVATFTERFRRFGFRAEAMMPVYGLAESTVGAAFPPYGRGPRLDIVNRRALERGAAEPSAVASPSAARTLVGVGRALPGHELRIVGPDDESVGERQVGQIELRGPSVMNGYHGHQEETERTIRPDGWLRTGDLGYVADGELYVVGRAKEIVKKAGAKYDAADIQAVVGEVQGVRNGCVAAFSIPNDRSGTEDLVIVAEVTSKDSSDHPSIEASIRRQVHGVFGTWPDDIRLIEPGTLPKSTSGKIRGFECRHRYLEGDVRPAAGA